MARPLPQVIRIFLSARFEFHGGRRSCRLPGNPPVIVRWLDLGPPPKVAWTEAPLHSFAGLVGDCSLSFPAHLVIFLLVLNDSDSILVWNARGLNNRARRNVVAELDLQECVSILSVQKPIWPL
jgi:hypothetical protein